MVDSILTNQAPIVTKAAENRISVSTAVDNASNIPEAEAAEEIIDVTPRSMDADPQASFSARGVPELRPPLQNFSADPVELRPSLENFGQIQLTSEKALENRVADIELRSNNEIDETSSIVNVNNDAIEAFVGSAETEVQQSVDLTA